MMKILSLIVWWGTGFAHGACLVQESSDMCAVGPMEVQAVQEFERCAQSNHSTELAVRQCQDKVSADVNDPMYELLGVAGIAALDPQVRLQVVNRFLEASRADMTDEFARLEYEREIRKPRLMAPHQVNDLITRHNQLERLAANGPNQKVRYQTFKNENREMLNLIRHLHSPGQAERPFPANGQFRGTVYRPHMVGGMDVANAGWDNLPAQVRLPNGQAADMKLGYQRYGERVYAAMAQELRSGKSLREALRAPSMSGFRFSTSALQDMRRTVRLASLHYRPSATGSPLAQRVLARRPQVKVNSRNNIFRLGMGLGVLSVGASVVGLQFANQQQCEQAYPYTPVSYQGAPISGNLPQSMKCRMDSPGSDTKIPNRMKTLLAKSEEEVLSHLNSDTGANSACRYLTEFFNSRFCNQNGYEPPASESESTR